jgi:hypothetical protein
VGNAGCLAGWPRLDGVGRRVAQDQQSRGVWTVVRVPCSPMAWGVFLQLTLADDWLERLPAGTGPSCHRIVPGDRGNEGVVYPWTTQFLGTGAMREWCTLGQLSFCTASPERASIRRAPVVTPGTGRLHCSMAQGLGSAAAVAWLTCVCS